MGWEIAGSVASGHQKLSCEVGGTWEVAGYQPRCPEEVEQLQYSSKETEANTGNPANASQASTK